MQRQIKETPELSQWWCGGRGECPEMSSGMWPLGEEGTSLVRVLRDENDVFKDLPAARVCSATAKMGNYIEDTPEIVTMIYS
ncbi:hypothetical protein TIFTF001_018108 [Ficus carica]|uniref:Uncharacterized protein n=1 Tax=Ficus carica TaxID=3494 RepID=A0AA88DBC4_FICCA|nr:hypothetical protein TIFTF001_018108 [Ficus carica]